MTDPRAVLSSTLLHDDLCRLWLHETQGEGWFFTISAHGWGRHSETYLDRGACEAAAWAALREWRAGG